MKSIYPPQAYLGDSGLKGAYRGVFATADFEKGQVIERSPVINMEREDYLVLRKTKLVYYYFRWGDNNEGVAIALGFGSLYNHSQTPNAIFVKKLAENIIEFVALKPIKTGEEVTIDYNHDIPYETSASWIKSVQTRATS